ncbi:MAG TPA: pyridoxamine 5'-phosphate oxidase family protein [Bryobacteraceae bacterium]|nr:pyridoxamine 5'-phosphate oxidase family protein [Bryobacteraceae bacterium]
MAASSVTKSDLFEFLDRHKLGVLGSVSPEGVPQSALVGIAVTPALDIIFDTVKSSRKYRNLVTKPACSFVVGWAGETTVQFQGDACQPSGGELAAYQEVYFKKWLDGPARLSWPGITYFVVRPTWIRYSDYDQNPPLIQEFNF